MIRQAKYYFPVISVFLAFVLLACQPLVNPQGAETMAADELLGIWRPLSLDKGPVLEKNPARIQFSASGDITGNASCNRFFGKYTYQQGKLAIEPLGSTRMMCLPELMTQEAKLLELLPQASHFSREGKILKLYNASGEVLLTAELEADN